MKIERVERIATMVLKLRERHGRISHMPGTASRAAQAGVLALGRYNHDDGTAGGPIAYMVEEMRHVFKENEIKSLD